ncbi:heat-repeat protein [Vairimorpha necatrix]|uniref:Heat-repeat protein n=1 Tax=Vairimorpha necatrix TaxID=6039 RepID=A0AAX4J9A1_9MICR
MDYIKKFNELKTNIYKNTDSIFNHEMSTLTQLLSIKDTSKINIHNKNDIIADYEFKKEVLNLILELIENNLIIKDKSLINKIADLIIKDIPEISVDFCLQLEDLVKKIWKICIKILFYCGQIEDLPQIKKFIENQNIPDLRNISLSLIFKCENFKSYDLENLSNFSSFSVLYEVVKLYKNELPEEIKFKILVNINNLISKEEYFSNEKYFLSPNMKIKSNIKITEKTLNFAYLIFYEINFLPFYNLIKVPKDSTFTNEYMMFLYSLVVDETSTLKIHQILQSEEVYSDLYNGVNSLVFNHDNEKQDINPEDEKYLFFILEVVVKMLYTTDNEIIKMYFLMFCDPLMKYSLVNDLNNNIIYDYLSYYCNDRETYLNIIEFYKSKKNFNRENIFTNSYNPSLIRFLWNINQDLSVELALYSLRSEDPETVKMCFEIFEKTDLDISNNILLNSNHIRRTILKSDELINIIINYQINKKIIIDDILLINVIMSTENYKFFEYAELFKDFGKYMNDKFLERLIGNIEGGLEFIENHITKNTVKFIKNNEKWFNLFLTNNKKFYPQIFKIYEKILMIDKNLEMSFEDGFLLLEVPESSVFRILSHKIVQNASFIDKKSNIIKKNIKNKYITNKEFEMDKEVLKDYVLYLKARQMVGDNIEPLVKFLLSDYSNSNASIVNDIVGYYKLMSGTNLDVKSENVLCTYDCKDTSFVIRNFYKVNDYEKNFLLMKLDDNISSQDEHKILKMIKDIITSYSSNKMLYRQCLTLLLKLNNIDGIVRLIEDYDDKNLLLKINIRNLMTGGLYFNPKLINVGNQDLQVAAVSLLYFKNVWNINSLRNWISMLYKECRDNEDIKYLVDDISKKHDIEIY